MEVNNKETFYPKKLPELGSGSGSYDYQYHLTDHLGNVRSTFTSSPPTINYLANFEIGSSDPADTELFDNVDYEKIRYTTMGKPNNGGNEAIYLNKDYPAGPGLVREVGPGDVLTIKAEAYYEGGYGYDNTKSVNAMTAAIAGVFGGVVNGTEAQQAIYTAFDNALAYYGLGGTDSDTRPAAYLNYILFDDDMQHQAGGFIQIEDNPYENQTLEFDDLHVQEAGFVYVYVTNRSDKAYRVHFDNIALDHQFSPVTQSNDYYPFGGTFNSYTRATAQPNNYLFNGNEWQASWKAYDFNARFYDPWGGPGFLQIDPMAEEREWLTPYNFAQNNPINRVDPDGRFDDFYIYSNGSVERFETGNIDNFYYVDQGLNVTHLATFERNKNGLIQLPANFSFDNGEMSFGFSIKDGQTDRAFVSPEATASLFGAFAETGFSDFTITQFSYSNGGSPAPSRSHKNGINGDIRYLRSDESGAGVTVLDTQFDYSRNTQFTQALNKFGYTDLLSFNVPFPHINAGILPNTRHYAGHDDHLHLQGFRPDIQTVGYPSVLSGPMKQQFPGINFKR